MRVSSFALRWAPVSSVLVALAAGLASSGCDDDDDDLSFTDSAQAALAMTVPTVETFRRLGRLEAPVPVEMEMEGGGAAEALGSARARKLATELVREAIASGVEEPVLECPGGGIVDETCFTRGDSSIFFFTFTACRREMDGSVLNGTVEVVVPDATACETGILTADLEVSALNFHRFVETTLGDDDQVTERVRVAGTFVDVSEEDDGADDGEAETDGPADGAAAGVNADAGDGGQDAMEIPVDIETVVPPRRSEVNATLLAFEPGVELSTASVFDDTLVTFANDPDAGTLAVTGNGFLFIDDQPRVREFEVELADFALNETVAEDGGGTVEIDGKIVTDCLGELAYMTIEPLVFPPDGLCPTSGVIEILIEARAVRYTFQENGTVGIDLGADGEIDFSQEPCYDLDFPRECRFGSNPLAPVRF